MSGDTSPRDPGAREAGTVPVALPTRAEAPATPPLLGSRPAGRWRISTELAAYVAITVVGAVLRLVGLGARPLGPQEAAVAMAALEGGAIGSSPLLHHGAAWAMRLFGDAAFAARLVPAVAGALLAPAAWGLRRAIGRGPALGAAAVLGLSPIWVVQSRMLEPTSLSLLLILWAVWAFEGQRPPWMAVCAALALAAGDLVWLAAAAAALTLPIALSMAGRGRRGAAFANGRPSPAAVVRWAAVFGFVLLLGVTGGTRLDGLGALAAAPAAWIEGLGRDRSDLVMGSVLPLLVHAPELVLFGLAGLVLGPRDQRWRIGIAIWLLLSLGVAMVSLSPWAAVLPLAPLALAAGVTLSRLAAGLRARFRWSEEGVMIWILLVVLGYALWHAWRFAHSGPVVGQRDDWVLMSGSLAMAAVLMLSFGALWGVATALRVAGVVGGIVALSLASANAVALDRHEAAEIWRPRRTASGASAVAQIARAAAAAPAGSIAVDPALREVLAWPLRGVAPLRWQAPAPDAVPATAWIAPEGDAGLDALVGAQGEVPRVRTLAIAYAWRPAFAERQGFLRWYLQRATRGDLNFRPIFPEQASTVSVVLSEDRSTQRAPGLRLRAFLDANKPHVVEGWR